MTCISRSPLSSAYHYQYQSSYVAYAMYVRQRQARGGRGPEGAAQEGGQGSRARCGVVRSISS